MNFRVTLAMLAVLILLAAGVWYLELREDAQTPTPAAELTIFELSPGDVGRIEIVDETGTVAAERREDDRWRLVAPTENDADQFRVDDTVARLAMLRATRRLDGGDQLAAYGLADPPTRIELRMKDGAEHGLDVGSKTPDTMSYYVKHRDGETVWIAPTFVIDDLKRWIAEPPRPRPTATALPPSSPVESPTPEAKP